MGLRFVWSLSTSSNSVFRSRCSARSRIWAYLNRVIISERRLLRRREAAFLESRKSSISSDLIQSIEGRPGNKVASRSRESTYSNQARALPLLGLPERIDLSGYAFHSASVLRSAELEGVSRRR